MVLGIEMVNWGSTLGFGLPLRFLMAAASELDEESWEVVKTSGCGLACRGCSACCRVKEAPGGMVTALALLMV